MIFRSSTREILAVSTAFVLIVSNLLLETLFIQKVRYIRHLQANPAICLAVPQSTKASEPLPDKLVLTLRTNGTLFVDDNAVELKSLGVILRARVPAKVYIRYTRGVGYAQIKPLLVELGNNGVKNVSMDSKPID